MSGTKVKNKERFLKVSVDDLVAAGIDAKTLEILTQLSQKEREESRKRQAEGIAAAKAKGVQLGRPKAELPDNFAQIAAIWESRALTLDMALKLCGVSESTFFRRLKKYREMTAQN
ncbi:putative transposon Tn552 DNA-invertase bin3 [Clostridiales bacterium]|nr:putative transposon Tn552 DNA-invertase bin3 [Clostridiales bacterium]